MENAGCEVRLNVAQWGVSVSRQHQEETGRTSQVRQLQHPYLMARGVLELAWGFSGWGVSSVPGAQGTKQCQTLGRASSQNSKQCILLTNTVSTSPSGSSLRPKTVGSCGHLFYS